MAVYLDTNFFVAALEGDGLLQKACERILLSRQSFFTSEMTLAEVLAGKHLAAQFDDVQEPRPGSLAETYSDLLTNGSPIRLVPIDRSILLAAAYCRSNALADRLPGAIHLATAARAQCERVVSSDQRMRPSAFHVFERIEVSVPAMATLLDAAP
jgi:predicted nucleic acid-binding protein